MNKHTCNVTLAKTTDKMASRKLSASEVLALLHPNDDDIFDDIHEPVQDGSDEEFDDSEDGLSDEERDSNCPDSDDADTDGKDLVEDSIRDRTDVSECGEVLQYFQPGTL